MQPSTSTPSPPAADHRSLREPLVFGTLCGLAAAVGYTAANACLRAVATCDPVWVSCVKAFPTVALFSPMLLLRLVRGREAMPTWRQLRALIIAALVCQLLGNVVFQWSLGAIGMALTVPLTLGTMIIGAAMMGRLFLNESVTIPMVYSMLVLIVAVVLLSWGAGESATGDGSSEVLAVSGSDFAGNDVGDDVVGDDVVGDDVVGDGADSPTTDHVPTGARHVLLGVTAACVSGLAYALLGVVIRSVVTDKTSVSMTLVTVTLTGLISLGAMSLWTSGLAAVLATPPREFWFMMLAGAFNAVAFLALTKSLQVVPVAYVNALNATQAAMGALAGILIFSEPSSWMLWLGVAMTALGLLLMRRPQGAKAGNSIARQDVVAEVRLAAK